MEGVKPKKHMSEAIVGIICEYDPFHLGHKRQFELIRSQLPQARIVCLMSGCFTQRGMPAVHLPAERARAALNAGADLVLELPCAFAVRDAENFAMGGVEILTKLGFVTHLSFGAESDPVLLHTAAELLERPTAAFTQALREALAEGLSFAAAQGRALAACLPGGDSPWERPNNILALCYLRAIRRLNSHLIPLPVLREGDYHAQSLEANRWPSATAVRSAFWAGDVSSASASCGWALPRSPVCAPDALDAVLLHRLRTASVQELALLPDCTEGLENRLKTCALQSISRTELLENLKTRRYPYARLSRLCAHALLGLTSKLAGAHAEPEYARVIGFRRDAQPLLTHLSHASLPLITRPAELRGNPVFELERRATDLQSLCFPDESARSMSRDLTERIVIV